MVAANRSTDSTVTTVGAHSPGAEKGASSEVPSWRKPLPDELRRSREFAQSEKVLGVKTSAVQGLQRASSMPHPKRRPPALIYVTPLTVQEGGMNDGPPLPHPAMGAGQLLRSELERKGRTAELRAQNCSASRSTSRESSTATASSVTRVRSKCYDRGGDAKPCSPTATGSRRLRKMFRLASWRSRKETVPKRHSPMSASYDLAPLPPGSKAPMPSPASTKWSEMKRKSFSFLHLRKASRSVSPKRQGEDQPHAPKRSLAERFWSKVTREAIGSKDSNKRRSSDAIFLRRKGREGSHNDLMRSQSEGDGKAAREQGVPEQGVPPTREQGMPPMKKSFSDVN